MTPKKGKKCLTISLTSILCKTTRHIITSAILRHLDIHQALNDAQQSQLILTTYNLNDSLEAFDKVPHPFLPYKPKFLGIDEHTLQWIKDFPSNRTEEVVVEGKSSQTSDATLGMPEDSVLPPPPLLLLYINDLLNYAKENSTVRLFVDDAVVYRMLQSNQNTENI